MIYCKSTECATIKYFDQIYFDTSENFTVNFKCKQKLNLKWSRRNIWKINIFTAYKISSVLFKFVSLVWYL